jgi:hypothetical protein
VKRVIARSEYVIVREDYLLDVEERTAIQWADQGGHLELAINCYDHVVNMCLGDCTRDLYV